MIKELQQALHLIKEGFEIDGMKMADYKPNLEIILKPTAYFQVQRSIMNEVAANIVTIYVPTAFANRTSFKIELHNGSCTFILDNPVLERNRNVSFRKLF